MFVDALLARINACIASTPNAQVHRKSLEGSSMRLIISDWDFTLSLRMHEGCLELFEGAQADVTLEGEGQALLSFAKSLWAGGAMVPNEALHIQGNVQVATGFRQLLQACPWEIEALLASWIGDRPAFYAQLVARKSARRLGFLAKHVVAQIVDHQAYESDDWVREAEMQAFSQSVDALKYAVERFERKVNERVG